MYTYYLKCAWNIVYSYFKRTDKIIQHALKAPDNRVVKLNDYFYQSSSNVETRKQSNASSIELSKCS